MNKFKGTQGKWEVVSRDEKYFHIDIDGESLLRFCKPKKYYTDYVRRVEDYACFAFVDKGDYSRNYYFQKSHMENIRVVGNIYNNKSLLK